MGTNYWGGGLYMYYYPPNGYVSLTFVCSSSQTTPLAVTNLDWDESSTYMSFTTPAVCQPQQVVNRQPASHNYMSGQIYIAGVMPMWTFDYVASPQGNTFEGHFYYSLPDLSFKLNGTLSNSKGQKSPVELIVSGLTKMGNPPTSVALFQPSSGKTVCTLLPTPKSSHSLYWFSTDANSESLVRSYESIYWAKGTTFNVTEYLHTEYYSLMQRSSDSVTV